MYQTPGGELLRGCDVNKHHVAWTEKLYTTKLGRKYRNMPGLVLPMVIEPHDRLHRLIPPPPKLNKYLMNLAIEFNDELDDSFYEDRYDMFHEMIGFFQEIAETYTSPERAELAFGTASNYIKQDLFVQAGRVALISDLQRAA